jgi:hypothetical protein
VALEADQCRAGELKCLEFPDRSRKSTLLGECGVALLNGSDHHRNAKLDDTLLGITLSTLSTEEADGGSQLPLLL